MVQRTDQERQDRTDLLLAVLVMVVYFAFMLTIAFAPQVFAAELVQGFPLSIGLGSGIAMAIFMIVLSAWYTRRRNRREDAARSDSVNG